MKELSKRKQALAADAICLLVAMIWGTGFIASQLAIDAHMSAGLIMVLRFGLAALVMALCCLPRLKAMTKHELLGGIVAGVVLFGGFYSQILGQQRTSISHCAFLTATNVVMVPFLAWAMTRRRPAGKVFAITAMTLAGIGILTLQPGEGNGFGLGDGLCLLCALFFALHISSMEWAVRDSDVLRVTLVQMATAAAISTAVFLATDLESVSAVNWSAGLPAVLFLGLLSTCLCYFLQTLAQKYTSPSQAGVLLSTEGLFGSLLSVILGMEALTVNLILGGLIIFLSVVLLEWSPKGK